MSNSYVIELLEAYLETAKRYKFDHVAIAMTGYPNIAACDYAGDIALEKGSQEALRLLSGKLKASIDNWSLPPRDETLDASHVCYNVANGPMGFDFIVWLIDQEMTRIRECAPPPLKVGFWLGQSGELSDIRRLWLEHVFRPALSFLNAVEDDRAILGRHKPLYVPLDVGKASKRGELVPVLRSHKTSPAPGAITITLREAPYELHRNSDLPEWTAFARLLQHRGERVIFVRDTAKADEPLEDFEICPAASIDLATRMALYQEARCNMFVSNGPGILANFSDRPWLQFVQVEEPPLPFTAQFWTEKMGISPGGQYHWSKNDQRIVWAKDTYENIISAWDDVAPIEPRAWATRSPSSRDAALLTMEPNHGT